MECLIIILVVSVIYFVFPSRKDDDRWDGSDIQGEPFGVSDYSYNTPSFPFTEESKKKTKKKTDKAKPLPKKVKKKTKRKTKKK
jgi:hypothetical protein